MPTLCSAAVVALGPGHQNVWRWFLCGVAGERGVWEHEFFGLQAAFPLCCGVKCTHQAVSLTAVDGRKRWVIFF